MSAHELSARQMIMYETYSHTLSIEAKTMVDIARSQILPAIERYLSVLCKNAKMKSDMMLDENAMKLEKSLIEKLSLLSYGIYDTANELEAANERASMMDAASDEANSYKNTVVPLMAVLRDVVDEAEKITPKDMWPLANYGELTYWN